ncbi:replication factor C large subunit [Candidatus Woesearchaeota archaeon]|nr:replication factor C large subunit [Candidatus Woesearchaeota archaeon]
MKLWTDKYAPAAGIEIPQEEISRLRDAILKKKAIFLAGPTGSGKTSAVYTIAKELNYEVLELNASDVRDKAAIEKIVGSAGLQTSLFAQGKIILIDELEGLNGTEDRGGLITITKILESSRWPIVLTTNEEDDLEWKEVKKQTTIVVFKQVANEPLVDILKRICIKEDIQYEEMTLKTLARRVSGDIRAGINDLYAASIQNKKVDITGIEDRFVEQSILSALTLIFKGKETQMSARIFDSTSLSLDDCFRWVEENLPLEYKNPKDLAKAFDMLSYADVFKGRIMRQQHWHYLVYQNILMSAGVALAKEKKSIVASVYQRPLYPLLVWKANMKSAKKKSIAEKIAKKCHLSKRRALRLFPTYKKMLKNPVFQKELRLNDEEKIYIMS